MFGIFTLKTWGNEFFQINGNQKQQLDTSSKLLGAKWWQYLRHRVWNVFDMLNVFKRLLSL